MSARPRLSAPTCNAGARDSGASSNMNSEAPAVGTSEQRYARGTRTTTSRPRTGEVEDVRRAEHDHDHRGRPRAKALAGIGGARSGRSRVVSTKKRADLGSSCHVGHGSATLVVGPTETKKLRKPGLMSATEKPAQTRQGRFFFDFWGVESTRTQPEATDRHRQTPLRAHPNTPQNRLFVAGGSTTAPLARGRSEHIFLHRIEIFFSKKIIWRYLHEQAHMLVKGICC